MCRWLHNQLYIGCTFLSLHVHERRDSIASHWAERDFEVDGCSVIPLSIGLAQQNLENVYNFLMDVSDPDSQNYEKRWSAEKIASICFQPS
jgi:tripeptidyl-peptidase-1